MSRLSKPRQGPNQKLPVVAQLAEIWENRKAQPYMSAAAVLRWIEEHPEYSIQRYTAYTKTPLPGQWIVYDEPTHSPTCERLGWGDTLKAAVEMAVWHPYGRK